MIVYLEFLTAGIRRRKLIVFPRRDLRRVRGSWLRRLIGGLT